MCFKTHRIRHSRQRRPLLVGRLVRDISSSPNHQLHIDTSIKFNFFSSTYRVIKVEKIGAKKLPLKCKEPMPMRRRWPRSTDIIQRNFVCNKKRKRFINRRNCVMKKKWNEEEEREREKISYSTSGDLVQISTIMMRCFKSCFNTSTLKWSWDDDVDRPVVIVAKYHDHDRSHHRRWRRARLNCRSHSLHRGAKVVSSLKFTHFTFLHSLLYNGSL